MSTRQSSTALRAVAYYRCSSLKQTDSIDRQKSQVEPAIVTQGFIPVGVYEEPGIPGDEFAKRPALQRLLRDAKAGRFDVIVVDELSRLSRQDVISFISTIIAPLREAGVKLFTVEQGAVDWGCLVGLLLLTIKQDKSASESPALARRVLSQMLTKAKKGDYLGGKNPYGYHVDWSQDAYKAGVARLIFELYDGGKTLGGVAEELRRRGVASPTGNPIWSRATLRELLRNKAYLGCYKWGERTQGKFLAATKGEIRTRGKGERRIQRNPVEDWTFIPGHHEPLVEPDLFQRVQERLASNQKRTTPHRNGGAFLLAKMLVCEHCGYRMTGTHNDQHQRVYICTGYIANGATFCHRHTTREDLLVPLLIRKLQEEFLAPERLQALREEAARQEEAERSPDRQQGLRTEAARLETKIAKVVERLAEGTIEEDNAAAVNGHLRKLREQHAAVLAELGHSETASPRRDLEEQIRAIESVLWDLQNALQEEDTQLLREIFRSLFARIELRFEHRATQARRWSVLVGGTLILHSGERQNMDKDLSVGEGHHRQVFAHVKVIKFRISA